MVVFFSEMNIVEGKSAWCTTGKTTGSSETAGGACLSADGSIAASWCGARLELWDTKNAVQKTSLAHPALRPQGRLVQFGRNHHMHFVCTINIITVVILRYD